MGPPGPRNSPFYSSLSDPEIRFVSSLRIQPCLLAPRRQEERPRLPLGARDFSSAVSRRTREKPLVLRVSSTQRQKFHTDDVKSVRNLVRSSDWST